jgi:hypothetical protein
MKKGIKIICFILLVLSVILFSGSSATEEYATPTDLKSDIIEDVSDEFIEPEIEELKPIEEISIDELYPNHHIEIRIIQHPQILGDEVILGFELIDYPPGYITAIEWQYSEDNIEWFPIEGETAETFKFIVTKDNYKLWYRVMVSYHFDLNI